MIPLTSAQSMPSGLSVATGKADAGQAPGMTARDTAVAPEIRIADLVTQPTRRFREQSRAQEKPGDPEERAAVARDLFETPIPDQDSRARAEEGYEAARDSYEPDVLPADVDRPT